MALRKTMDPETANFGQFEPETGRRRFRPVPPDGAFHAAPPPFTSLTALEVWTPSGARHDQGAMTGFTTPAVTYDKMRQMQLGSARPLDHDIRTNVVDPTFRSAWAAWYEQAWLPFYEKYAGDDPSTLAKLSAAFTSDAIAARAESYRQQLSDFYVSYPQQRTASGQLVPPPTGASPALIDVPSGQSAFSLPWWAWAIGIAGVAGLGYAAYRQAQDLQRKKAGIEKYVLPKIIGEDWAKAYSYKGESSGSGSSAKAKTSRDPGCGCGKPSAGAKR